MNLSAVENTIADESGRVASYKLVIGAARGVGWLNKSAFTEGLNLPPMLEASGETKEQVLAALKRQVAEADRAAVGALIQTRPARHRAKYGQGEGYAGLGVRHDGNFRRCGDCATGVGPYDPACSSCRAYVCLLCASCGCRHSNWVIQR